MRHPVTFCWTAWLWTLAVINVTCAAGGTAIVAHREQPVGASDSWADGVADLINDPVRTTGWNSWFSEWPNDVNHYAMEIQNMDDLNRLIVKLARIQSDLKEVRLCVMKEPRGLGWVTSLDEGNGIPVMFTLGDQQRMNEWYAQVRKPFGVMKFVDTPVAVPPTLTIFVMHPLVDLSALKIPTNITVKYGHLPGPFHRSNTTLEKELEQKRQASETAANSPALIINDENLDESTRQAVDAINTFLRRRQKQQKEASKLPRP